MMTMTTNATGNTVSGGEGCLGRREEVLEELARELDKVPQHRRACADGRSCSFRDGYPIARHGASAQLGRNPPPPLRPH